MLCTKPHRLATRWCHPILLRTAKHRGVISTTAAINSLEETPTPQDDGVVGSHIEDDICTSPKPGEGAAASRAWLSPPFYAHDSVTPKAYRIQAAADPTRSDWEPVAANAS